MADKTAEAVKLMRAHGTLKAASEASGIAMSTLHQRYHKGLAEAKVSKTETSEIEFQRLRSSFNGSAASRPEGQSVVN